MENSERENSQVKVRKGSTHTYETDNFATNF